MPVLSMPEGVPSGLTLYTTDKDATAQFFSQVMGYGLDEREEGTFLTLESIPIATLAPADFDAWSPRSISTPPCSAGLSTAPQTPSASPTRRAVPSAGSGRSPPNRRTTGSSTSALKTWKRPSPRLTRASLFRKPRSPSSAPRPWSPPRRDSPSASRRCPTRTSKRRRCTSRMTFSAGISASSRIPVQQPTSWKRRCSWRRCSSPHRRRARSP